MGTWPTSTPSFRAARAPPPGVVHGGEQLPGRTGNLAVERVAVGDVDARAAGDDVDELARAELGEVEAVEQREFLQPHGPDRLHR